MSVVIVGGNERMEWQYKDLCQKKTFRTYKKCTDCYCRQKAKGVPIARLAVAG